MDKIKAVIFDIDGTLTTRVSWNFLVEYLGGDPAAERKNYLDWSKGLITFEECDRNLLKLWRSDNRANKKEFGQAFNLIPVRPEAQEVIDYLKSVGKEICLITGAMDMYAEIMAQRLGVKYYYGNTILNWDKNEEIKSFDYTPNQSEKKLEHFADFCAKLNLNPSECVAVGDSDNDRGLFELTKQGIAIRSEFEDDGLEKVAWKVIQNLSEIKDLVK